MIAMIVTIRMSNENSLEHQAGAYLLSRERNTLYYHKCR